MKDYSLKLLCMIWVVLVILLIGVIYNFPRLTGLESNENNKCDITNSSLIEQVNCLRMEQGKWWKYNASNKAKYIIDNIDWDVIKEEGGVCRHSVVWYVEEAKNMGLLARQINFFPHDGMGHAVALIYDENMSGYCILDQQAMPKCLRLDNVGDDKP